MEIQKRERPLMEMSKNERIERLEKEIAEVREMTDNQDYLDSLDMCEKDLECGQVHETIDRILRTIKILVRKQT
jgi:hypothetical protein